MLGELAAQWQQMMETLPRVEEETVAPESLANAIENMCKTRIDATGNRLRLKDGEPHGGFAREVAAWLLIRSTRAEKLIQRITSGTLTATEAWIDGRHAEDDKYVELDYELAAALANVAEGAARSTVVKVTQVEPSHGFRGMASTGLTAMRPSHRMTQLQRCNTYSRHPKDARTHRSELKEKLTAWSLTVAEYEH